MTPILPLQVIVGTTPQMALVKVVSDELTELMGSKGAKDLEQGFPQIVLMAGLQVCSGLEVKCGARLGDLRELQLNLCIIHCK
jgi:signal recognition particle GTPase